MKIDFDLIGYLKIEDTASSTENMYSFIEDSLDVRNERTFYPFCLPYHHPHHHDQQCHFIFIIIFSFYFSV